MFHSKISIAHWIKHEMSTAFAGSNFSAKESIGTSRSRKQNPFLLQVEMLP